MAPRPWRLVLLRSNRPNQIVRTYATRRRAETVAAEANAKVADSPYHVARGYRYTVRRRHAD